MKSFKLVFLAHAVILLCAGVVAAEVKIDNRVPREHTHEPPGTADRQDWTPKWKVGNWWIVEYQYDSAKFSPIAAPVKSKIKNVPIKYTVARSGILNKTPVLVITVRALDATDSLSMWSYDIYVSTASLQLKRVIQNPLGNAYVRDYQDTYGLAVPGEWRGILLTLPYFPSNPQFEKGSQIVERVSASEENIPNRLKRGKPVEEVFKVSMGFGRTVEFWSKDLPWPVYSVSPYDEKVYLIDYSN